MRQLISIFKGPDRDSSTAEIRQIHIQLLALMNSLETSLKNIDVHDQLFARVLKLKGIITRLVSSLCEDHQSACKIELQSNSLINLGDEPFHSSISCLPLNPIMRLVGKDLMIEFLRKSIDKTTAGTIDDMIYQALDNLSLTVSSKDSYNASMDVKAHTDTLNPIFKTKPSELMIAVILNHSLDTSIVLMRSKIQISPMSSATLSGNEADALFADWEETRAVQLDDRSVELEEAPQ